MKEADESSSRRHAEEELRRSQEQYRDLLENATDLIQSVTPDGRFLYVNHAWRRTLEYSEAEVGQLTIYDVLHPEYHESWRDRMVTAKPDEACSWEAIFLTKYGRHLYVEGNTSARFEARKVVACRGIFHDVTEKKLALVALKRSIRQYEDLVNSVDGIVWQAELHSMRFSFVSRQAERLLGYPAKRWLEEENFWQNHIHPDDRETAMALRAELNAGQKFQNVEYRMVAADGGLLWIRDIVSVRTEEGHAPQIQGPAAIFRPNSSAPTKTCCGGTKKFKISTIPSRTNSKHRLPPRANSSPSSWMAWQVR